MVVVVVVIGSLKMSPHIAVFWHVHGHATPIVFRTRLDSEVHISIWSPHVSSLSTHPAGIVVLLYIAAVGTGVVILGVVVAIVVGAVTIDGVVVVAACSLALFSAIAIRSLSCCAA